MPAYPKSQQLYNDRRGKKNQRKRGAISPSVRLEVRERSKDVCEVQKRCIGATAVHMAHLASRNTIDDTTADMLRHACLECHLFLDTTADGIIHKRQLREGA